MKHLKVEYNDIVLFDGEVEEVSWNDSASGVTVTGKFRRSGGGGGLMELLAGARKQQTENIVAERRAELTSGE